MAKIVEHSKSIMVYLMIIGKNKVVEFTTKNYFMYDYSIFMFIMPIITIYFNSNI